MKDATDRKTGELLKSPGAARQERYRAKQEAAGRRQRVLWLSDQEAAEVAAMLNKMRGEKCES